MGYFFLRDAGLFFVSMCMGGSVTAAARMPAHPVQRSGSMTFAMSTIAAAIWANTTAGHSVLTLRTVCLLVFTFICGVAGVVFLPDRLKLSRSNGKKDHDKKQGSNK